VAAALGTDLDGSGTQENRRRTHGVELGQEFPRFPLIIVVAKGDKSRCGLLDTDVAGAGQSGSSRVTDTTYAVGALVHVCKTFVGRRVHHDDDFQRSYADLSQDGGQGPT
jgi:hypothetical protein